MKLTPVESAMVASSTLILVVLTVEVFRIGWRRLPLFSVKDREKSEVTPLLGEEAEEASDKHLARYLEGPVRRLAWSFLLAYGFWCLFYLCLSLTPFVPDGPRRALHFLADLMTNITSFCLIYFYFELSAFDRIGVARRRTSDSRLISWWFLGAAILIFEMLWTFASQAPLDGSDPQPLPFRVVLGLGQATALFLVIGRLDSFAIGYHIRAAMPIPDEKSDRKIVEDNARNEHLQRLQRYGVPVGYLYAAIQPLYVLFDEREPWIPVVLVWIALALKLYLLYWICLLFERLGPADKPTAMEYHLFEMIRFRTEEGSSFERSFLRRHLNPIYRQRFRERKIGYLGVEYAYLNDHKLSALHLDHYVGAILVREVYAGSSASKQGVRVNDLITAIDSMPLSTSNRLSRVLVGTAPNSTVEVEVLRKREPSEPVSGIRSYCRLRFQVRLHEYDELLKPRVPREARVELGCEFMYDSRASGVVCSWPDVPKHGRILGIRSLVFGRYYETPDVKMLRIALGHLLPGELIEIHGNDIPPAGRRLATDGVRMACGHDTDPPTNQGRGAPPGRSTAMEETIRSKFVELYPERFGAPEAVLIDADASVLDEGCWVLFVDECFARVAEFCLMGPRALKQLSTSRLWERVDSGKIHAHARVLRRAADGKVTIVAAGAFRSLEYDQDHGGPYLF